MHKKYHEKFKILDILAVTTQAHEGIETFLDPNQEAHLRVTTQAHEGIETQHPWEQEIIRRLAAYQLHRNLTPPRGSHLAAPIACSFYNEGLWLDRSIIVHVAFIAVP